MAPRDPAREFRKLLRDLSAGGSKRQWEIYQDFCELAFCALSKTAEWDADKRERREARYMEMIARYSHEDAQVFPKMLALTHEGIEDGTRDFLGSIYEEEGFGDQRFGGQFFTPWPVAEMMARVTYGDGGGPFENKPFVTVAEPACGAGRMILAFANVVRSEGAEPGKRVWFDGTDLDRQCAFMTYVQMALAGIAGIVRHANSISFESFDKAVTPAGVDLILSNELSADQVHWMIADHRPPPPPPPTRPTSEVLPDPPNQFMLDL